jgi:hypothetical protein
VGEADAHRRAIPRLLGGTEKHDVSSVTGAQLILKRKMRFVREA